MRLPGVSKPGVHLSTPNSIPSMFWWTTMELAYGALHVTQRCMLTCGSVCGGVVAVGGGLATHQKNLQGDV